MKWLLLILGSLGLALTAAGDGLRDPMRPPLRENHITASGESAPVLSAVLNFNGERTAIFNGHLVRRGSAQGTYMIEAVLEDGVRYRHAGLTKELHMIHTVPTLKKPAADAAQAPSGVH
jgi:hypothetical protein